MVHAVIVGAGALGSACAVRLARAGARVTVFDPAPAGDNASGVAAGMLAPALEAALDPAAASHVELLRRAAAAWPPFADALGIELDRRGSLAAGSADFIDRVAARLAACGARGLALDGRAVREACPGLGLTAEAGLLVAGDLRVEASYALAAMQAAAQAAGARWRREPVARIGPDGVETADGSFVAADRIVVATGAARGLAAEAEALSPIKGHILRAPGLAYQGPMVRGEDIYIVPGAAGVLAGATMEPGVRDLTPDAAKIAGLAAAAAQVASDLATAGWWARTGLRAATPDGLPWVGPGRGERTLLALGSRRNGWLLAPLVAEAICAYVFDRAPPPWAVALRPDRTTEGAGA